MRIKNFLLKLVRILIYLVPRNKNIWITGSVEKWFDGKKQPNFVDNSKYLFIYLVEKTQKEVYWLTEEKEIYNDFKAKGLPVLYKYSLKGFFKAITAKVYFSHYGRTQITNLLDCGSIQINMWHGTPLKYVRYDVEPLVINPKKKFRVLLEKILKINNEEYVSSTSKFLSEKIIKRAFAVDENHLLNMGYPRMDIFGCSKEKIKEICKKYSPELIETIKTIEKFEKTIIYMPTWRDTDPYYLKKSDLNLEKLNKKLRKKNILFILKLHPLTEFEIENMSNIMVLENNIDIYPILPFTNSLITDYSSIYFDYLLLDKEIIFLPFDKEEYIRGRKLYFDYNEVTPGIKINSFAELEMLLDEFEELDFKDARKEIKQRFIENYKFDASEQIYNFFDRKGS